MPNRRACAKSASATGAALMLLVCACLASTLAASGGMAQPAPGAQPKKPPPTPEEAMDARFPQPVKVSFLIGLPMLDEHNSTLGKITSVQKTEKGKIELIVGYGGFLGFGERPVAVPVELAAMLGHDVAASGMPGAKFKTAPTWTSADGTPLAPSETIRVGIIRR